MEQFASLIHCLAELLQELAIGLLINSQMLALQRGVYEGAESPPHCFFMSLGLVADIENIAREGGFVCRSHPLPNFWVARIVLQSRKGAVCFSGKGHDLFMGEPCRGIGKAIPYGIELRQHFRCQTLGFRWVFSAQGHLDFIAELGPGKLPADHYGNCLAPGLCFVLGWNTLAQPIDASAGVLVG
ncbi:hypothetical protein DVH29_15000 [Pelagibacterium lacus]|uniref:Uncharacterized protein n=1 Tax=Pelagibacterium lacus TaxID=2282655 RepID=A0A369W6S1_9HYPH|nr:hypothetical protein DVH29_15000 [Pelagibacterium lacus]